MPNFLHFDWRDGRSLLRPGMILRPKPWSKGKFPPSLHAPLSALFPLGLSPVAEDLMLRRRDAVKWRLAYDGKPEAARADADEWRQLELVFELVRRTSFAELPNRYSAVFAAEHLAFAVAAWDNRLRRNGTDDRPVVWELEPLAGIFRADMNWLEFKRKSGINHGDPLADLVGRAQRYWSGQPCDRWKPRWEHVLEPPVRVVRRVEISNDDWSEAIRVYLKGWRPAAELLAEAEPPASAAEIAAIPDFDALCTAVLKAAPLADSAIHGVNHWRSVAHLALRLARETPGADATVGFLFGLCHDAARLDEGIDREHGRRAVPLVEKLQRDGLLHLAGNQLSVLRDAIARHADGQTTADPTVGCCWDADRLCLPRVGIAVNPRYLSTAAAPTDAMRGLASETWQNPPAWWTILEELAVQVVAAS